MNFHPYIAPALGFGFTYGLIRFLLPRAERLGLIDHPDGDRKHHTGKTPIIGGIAILVGLSMAALFAGFADLPHPAFWACYFLVALTGIVDDISDREPHIKFVAQIGAALLMIYWGGLALHTLGNLVSNEPLTLGRFAVPLTVFAIIGVINAINLCDGADGLSGGLVAIAVFWIALLSALSMNAVTLALALGLLGCLAAFLAFNLRSPWRGRAAIFLGDAGSLSLGFILAWLTVDVTQGGAQPVSAVTAIWLLAIPISDTIVCMSRRLARGRSPFRPDRTHLHHILIDLGMPVSRAVALIHVVAFLLAGVGVAGWILRVPEYFMFYAAMAVFSIYVILVQYGLRRVVANPPGLGVGAPP